MPPSSKASQDEEDNESGFDAESETQSENSVSKVTQDIHFSFGPHRSYFMHLRNRWWFHGSQSICDKLDDMGVNIPYVAALGPDDTYIFAHKNNKNAPAWNSSLPKGTSVNFKTWKKGSNTCWATSTESRGDAWTVLQSWITDNFTCDLDSFKNSTVVFGTGTMYYAKTPKRCLWNNIPADLEKTITDHMADRGPPSEVCLGVNNTWVAFWDGGEVQWNLKSYYDEVHKKLAGSTVINRLVLDPYSSDFFLHQEDGIICWSVQFDNRVTRTFVQRCQAYMQERAREDGSTFHLNNAKVGSKTTKSGYVISPTTKWDVISDDTITGKVLLSLPVPEAWSERIRRTASGGGWSFDPWSGAAVGVFGMAIAVLRRGRRFFRR